jgi:steroid delta-isomerase
MTDSAASRTARYEQIRTALGTYLDACRSLDVDRIVASFAPDAVVEDPTGPDIRGHEGVRRYFTSIYDDLARLELDAGDVFFYGDSAACAWFGRATTKAGEVLHYKGIDTFELDEEARIARMRAFWDPAELLGEG